MKARPKGHLLVFGLIVVLLECCAPAYLLAALVVSAGWSLATRDAIAFLEPTAEVDIGAALRAEGLVGV
jgi:hypothetical protein